jgi:outer membrane protein OmpA-like peptidoglycan-associated protein
MTFLKNKNFYLYFLFMFFFMYCICFSYSANLDSLQNNSVQVQSDLTFNMLSNRTLDGWYVTPKNLRYDFHYDKNKGNSDWTTRGSEVLSVDTSFKTETDNSKFKGMLGFYAFGGYAPTLWRPINEFHRLYDDNNYMYINKTDVSFSKRYWSLRYFRGIEHYDWSQNGDTFGLYTAQFETDRYLNISGRAVPEGVELNINTDSYGNLLVIGGEPVWGYKQSVYGKYNYAITNFDTNIIYKQEKIPWGKPDEKKEAFSLSSKLGFLYLPVELAGMYQPFRLDEEYTYVDEVSFGFGDYGSKYIVKKDKTAQKDAFGYALKISPQKFLPFLEAFDLKYSYQGLVAGDKKEMSAYVQEHFLDRLWLTAKFIDREPVIGPNPYLYFGTKNNPGPVYLSPRGSESPFSVDSDNRKATLLHTALTYTNPSLLMNFYKYEPGNLESWNINEDPNVNFACALGYNLEYYPTTTDRLFYWDEFGNVVWEPYNVNGLWKTTDPISSVDFILKSFIEPDFTFLLFLKGGQSLSTGSMSYQNNSKDTYKASTNMLSVDVDLIYAKYKLSLGYGENVWGPEEWQRRFGITVDNLYRIGLFKNFDKWGELGLEYLNVLQDDYKTLSSVEIGSFEEVKASWSWKFNSIFVFKEAKISDEDKEQDNKVPVVEVTSSLFAFTPNDDGINDRIDFDIFSQDDSGIESWWLIIKSVSGQEILRMEKQGTTPEFLEWNGFDYKGSRVKEGRYCVIIGVKDNQGNRKESEPLYFDVVIPAKIADKKIIENIVKYGTITEDERGIIITVPSASLFEDNGYSLQEKDPILDAVYEIVKNNSNYKVRIECHSDNKGKQNFKKNLTIDRAQEIKAYFTDKGLNENMFDVIGFGGKQPVASNNTAKGREKNNRVEIILLH